jgi:hypothetical protein
LEKFSASIDINDIVSVQKLRGVNKSNEHVNNPKEKKYYLYDYYIQINLSTVNGNTLK